MNRITGDFRCINKIFHPYIRYSLNITVSEKIVPNILRASLLFIYNFQLVILPPILLFVAVEIIWILEFGIWK